MAFYGYARLVDELGDSYRGDRLAALDWIEAETTSALADPDAAGLASLVADAGRSVRALSLDPAPLFKLIAANRQDQVVTTYETFEDLLGYCALSADPVGHLVLGVFGAVSPGNLRHSDSICSGLQLVEHWQDVAEDAAAGRVYLPQEDLARFGVSAAELRAGAPASRSLRALMVFEAAWARRMLDEGAPLIAALAAGCARRWPASGPVGRPRSTPWATEASIPGPTGRSDSPPGRGADAGRLATGPGGPGGGVNLDQAYERCEQITTEQARNFSYGIKLLPDPKRKAMSALYAMARRIDDIGDGSDPAALKLAALADIRKDLAAIENAGRYLQSDDPVLVALADAIAGFGIPVPAWKEIVEGCEMDVNGVSYQTFDDLVGYCRRVAGSVGRLSLAVYGTTDPVAAEPLADALGVALQITNILRRHSRGPPGHGPGVPPRRRPGAILAGGRSNRPARRHVRPYRVRGGPGRGVVRPGPRSTSAARLEVQGVHRGHGGHDRLAAHLHPARPGGRAARAHVRPGMGNRRGGHPGAGAGTA